MRSLLKKWGGFLVAFFPQSVALYPIQRTLNERRPLNEFLCHRSIEFEHYSKPFASLHSQYPEIVVDSGHGWEWGLRR